jgi:uncharacterized protein (TIGR00369 family)
MAIPEGFEPHFRKSPVTDPWEPLYSRRSDGVLEIGLHLDTQHCNARGFAHGGVIAALADNAMGMTYVASRAAGLSDKTGAVTLSLSLDYAAVGRIGQWLQIAPRIIKAGKTIGFVDALILADGETIARGSATFMAV